jgi:hypothetical protein
MAGLGHEATATSLVDHGQQLRCMYSRSKDTVGLSYASIAGSLSAHLPPLHHTFPRPTGKGDFGREATATSVNDPFVRHQYRPRRSRATADLGGGATGALRDGLRRPPRDRHPPSKGMVGLGHGPTQSLVCYCRSDLYTCRCVQSMGGRHRLLSPT